MTREWLTVAALVAACTTPTGGEEPEPSPPSGSTSTSTSTSTGPVSGEEGSSAGAIDDGETGASTSSAATSSDTTDDSGSRGSTTATDPVEHAIEQGIAGTDSLSDDDIVILLLMDVMHRRYAIEEFGDAAARYDEVIAALGDVPIDAIAFRRIFDPTQELTLAELEQIAPGVNQLTVPAMYCDTLPLPPGYGDQLAEGAALGGYELTHVVIALVWVDDLGCSTPVDTAFREQVEADTFTLIDPSDGLDDLELEAALFGTLLAGPDGLPVGVVDQTLAGQLDDGTWPRNPGDPDGTWHTTALALMLLLELHREPLDTFLAT